MHTDTVELEKVDPEARALRFYRAVLWPGPEQTAPGQTPQRLQGGCMSERQLYDTSGQRKYLSDNERAAFLRAAETAPRETRSLCLVLAHTGCRISEALALTADRVDLDNGTVIFESKKKRRTGIYRAVPVPRSVLDALNSCA